MLITFQMRRVHPPLPLLLRHWLVRPPAQPFLAHLWRHAVFREDGDGRFISHQIGHHFPASPSPITEGASSCFRSRKVTAPLKPESRPCRVTEVLTAPNGLRQFTHARL